MPFSKKLVFNKGIHCLTNQFVITGISEEEKKRLLHCVIIGGGPTGVEFSGELSDFIMRDVQERYSHVKDYIKVTLIEVFMCNRATPSQILSK